MKIAGTVITLLLLVGCGATPLDRGGGGFDGGVLGPDGGGPDGGGSRPNAPDVIACGQATCDAATQDCCISPQGEACGPKGTCFGAALSCSSAASCAANEVCCLETQSGEPHASCRPQCGGRGSAQVCASDAECPIGTTCRSGGFGFNTCTSGGSGGRPDGGREERPDGGPWTPPDAGTGGTGLACGRAWCDPATQDCCLSNLGARCEARGTCPGPSLSCTSAAACTDGLICCAGVSMGGAGMSLDSWCAAGCEADGGFTLQLCATESECPDGQQCEVGALGIRVCRGGGGGPGPGGGF
jgi:hypothetical protein